MAKIDKETFDDVFDIVFDVTREGFNGECAYNHCCHEMHLNKNDDMQKLKDHLYDKVTTEGVIHNGN